jgi:poly-gamma-glutamate synthesis protein (capsule biosynthesis protein)
MVLAHLRDRRIHMLEILPYERADNRVARLGSRRDAAKHLAYLEQLSHILGSKDFDGYWQQLAIDRLPAYEPILRSRLASSRITWRKRIRDTIDLGRAARNLWLDTRSPATGDLPPALTREALGTLNSIRCDSHRWVIETALSVLSGECPDLRSPAIREQLKAMAPFYAYGR